MSVLYESGRTGPDGEWVENVAWEIGILMCRHKDECAVRLDLERTAVTMRGDGAKRLADARATVCTCGAGHRLPNRLKVKAQPCLCDSEVLHLSHDRGVSICGRGVTEMQPDVDITPDEKIDRPLCEVCFDA